MKYHGMPSGMWLLFEASFRRNLQDVLHYSDEEARVLSKAAGAEYRAIIERLPEFERGDRFKTNIVSCAMFSAFLLQMHPLPAVEVLTDYYRESMMIPAMNLFCRIMGKRKFTKKDLEGMKKTAQFRAADRNPYSWNMDYLPYEDGSGYEARFTRCGICTLMTELGLKEAIPAMCALDYTMADAGKTSRFVREHTLALGGPYCDCGYQKAGRR